MDIIICILTYILKLRTSPEIFLILFTIALSAVIMSPYMIYVLFTTMNNYTKTSIQSILASTKFLLLLLAILLLLIIEEFSLTYQFWNISQINNEVIKIELSEESNQKESSQLNHYIFNTKKQKLYLMNIDKCIKDLNKCKYQDYEDYLNNQNSKNDRNDKRESLHAHYFLYPQNNGLLIRQSQLKKMIVLLIS